MDQPRFSYRIPAAPVSPPSLTGRGLTPPEVAASARALVVAFGPTKGAEVAADLKAEQLPGSADARYFEEVGRHIEQQLFAHPDLLALAQDISPDPELATHLYCRFRTQVAA